MNTNSKEFTATVKQYILDAIDSEAYEVTTTTEQEKLQFLADAFRNEYLHTDNLKRYGSIQNCLKEWLMGLPSVFNVDYTNFDILRISTEWGSLPANATEKEEDKIIANWFNFIAFKTLQLMAKNNIYPTVKTL